METVLRGQMTDDEFRLKLRDWSSKYKGSDLVCVVLDTDLEPYEAIAGPGSEVRMGRLAYIHCRTHTQQDHENN